MPQYTATPIHNEKATRALNENRQGSVLDFIDDFTKRFPAYVDEYETLLTDNRIWKQRTVGIGVVSPERALQLGCGIGFDTQLALGLARASAGGAHADGLALGGKTSLWKGSEDAGLALAYSLAWGRAGGGSWEHAETALNLAYSRPTSKELTLHANLGHARDEIGGAAATTWSLALEHAGFGALAPMAEVFGDDREGPWWNLGLRWTVADEKFYIDASYGRQMASGRARLVTLGFKFAF
jgi:hypothetical protein